MCGGVQRLQAMWCLWRVQSLQPLLRTLTPQRGATLSLGEVAPPPSSQSKTRFGVAKPFFRWGYFGPYPVDNKRDRGFVAFLP